MSKQEERNQLHWDVLRNVRKLGISTASPQFSAAYKRELIRLENERAPEKADEGREALRRYRAVNGYEEGDVGFATAYEAILGEVRDERAAKSRTTTAAVIPAAPAARKAAAPPTAAPRPPQPPKAVAPFVVTQSKAPAQPIPTVATTKAVAPASAAIPMPLQNSAKASTAPRSLTANVVAIAGKVKTAVSEAFSGGERGRLKKEALEALNVLEGIRSSPLNAEQKTAYGKLAVIGDAAGCRAYELVSAIADASNEQRAAGADSYAPVYIASIKSAIGTLRRRITAGVQPPPPNTPAPKEAA